MEEKPKTPPLGTLQYRVHFLKPNGVIRSKVMEVENNSMATTNLVYDFYKLYPNYKITCHTKM